MVEGTADVTREVSLRIRANATTVAALRQWASASAIFATAVSYSGPTGQLARYTARDARRVIAWLEGHGVSVTEYIDAREPSRIRGRR